MSAALCITRRISRVSEKQDDDRLVTVWESLPINIKQDLRQRILDLYSSSVAVEFRKTAGRTCIDKKSTPQLPSVSVLGRGRLCIM